MSSLLRNETFARQSVSRESLLYLAKCDLFQISATWHAECIISLHDRAPFTFTEHSEKLNNNTRNMTRNRKDNEMDGLEREREKLLTERDAAERRFKRAQLIAAEAVTARREACAEYNNACMDVYNYDVSQWSD